LTPLASVDQGQQTKENFLQASDDKQQAANLLGGGKTPVVETNLNTGE